VLARAALLLVGLWPDILTVEVNGSLIANHEYIELMVDLIIYLSFTRGPDPLGGRKSNKRVNSLNSALTETDVPEAGRTGDLENMFHRV
jgi:hypothetical protein